MRICYVAFGKLPRAMAQNGGEVRLHQDVLSLAALGHSVVGVFVAPDEAPSAEAGPFEQVLTIPDAAPSDVRAGLGDRIRTARSSGHSLHAVREQVAKHLLSTRPEVVWAINSEGISALPLNIDVPILASQTDFRFRIDPLRRGRSRRFDRRLRQDVRTWFCRDWELRQFRRARVVAAASATEAAELRAAGVDVVVIPVVAETLTADPVPGGPQARFFLFGKSDGTAMRRTRGHLRAEIWPRLAIEPIEAEWHQVGIPPRSESADWTWVQKHFVVHGFVEDVGSLFRLGDACLVPYTEMTGFRVKFVTAAAHGVVSIGYRSTFECAPEFTPGVDCLAADTPEELVTLVRAFSADRNLRERLGRNARALYEREFTFESQLPKYAEVLDRALTG